MKALLFLIAAACLASAADSPNALTSAEKKEGWKLLFDGTSLAGWEPHKTFDEKATGDWSVSDGALLCPGTTAGWLGSAGSYSDFHLRLQFKGAENVNSGVFLRSQKEGQPHQTGYELQIWDYQPAGFNTGSLVGSVKAPPAKIVGDRWNDYDITAAGNHFVVVLNGKTILDAHDDRHASGGIGFQCQAGYRIEFRSIRVLPLGK
jgi:hypothetical protein